MIHPFSFVVFDTETTGLAADARIVEIAAVRVDVATGAIVATFEALVKPDVAIPPEATRLHSIDEATVADAPGIDDVLPRFLSFLGDGPGVAHYAPFDLERLRFEARRIGVPLSGAVPVWDTIPLSRVSFPGAGSRSLGALSERLHLRREGEAHRALSDVKLAARLALRCLDGFAHFTSICPPCDRL